jgi:hypothetical protein
MTTAAPQTLDLGHGEVAGDDSCSDFYSPELEAQGPFFNRATQAELVRRLKDLEAGRNVLDDLRNQRARYAHTDAPGLPSGHRAVSRP